MSSDGRDVSTLRREVPTVDLAIVWFYQFYQSPLFTRTLGSVAFESAELPGVTENLEIIQNC